MYLIIGKVDGYIECNSTECKFPEEKNKRKYLVFGSIDENKEVFKKDTELWDGIKNEIETINGGKNGEYGKDFMKITFNTDDNFPLNKPLKLQLLTIIVTCIFEEDGKFYPQFYLDDCLYELRVANNLQVLEFDRIDISEEIDVNKTNVSKNVIFVTIGILKILVLNMSHVFAMAVMI